MDTWSNYSTVMKNCLLCITLICFLGGDVFSAAASSKNVHLILDDNLKVVRLNGKTKPPKLIPSKEGGKDISLPPGTHELVLRYIAYFDIGDDDFDVFKSRPVTLTLTGQAGDQFKVNYVDPAQHSADPDDWDRNVMMTLEQTAFGPERVSSPDPETPRESSLEVLKAAWESATPEERREFMSWTVK